MSREAMKLALQQALDKMAENARELGIQMQPEEPRAWFTVDELNAWADKKLKENPQWAEQPAQQEPLGFMNAGNILEMRQGSLPYAYVYPVKSTGVSVAVYTTPPAQRKPLPQGEWPKHPSPYVNDQYRGYLKSDLDDYAMWVLAAHGIKENT